VTEPLLPAVVAGLFGLAFGSFLNVCTIRWPEDRSVVHPRSRCPRCDALIHWYDNLPVLSWIVLRGRCRSCGEPISLQYPLVEMATALIWAGLVWYHGIGWEAVRGALFLTIVFGISLSDARYYVIPDQFSVGGTVLGLGMAFLPGGIRGLDALVGAATGYVGLWLVGLGGTWLVRRLNPSRLEDAGVESALGGGDVKMMMMVGAFLGPWGVALTVFLGSVLALVVYGPISLLTKKLIPLGIFLAAGGALAYGWGDAILDWYLGGMLGLR
jgi:leader peptidase (prepilin peptidase)/N-methyltransferase